MLLARPHSANSRKPSQMLATASVTSRNLRKFFDPIFWAEPSSSENNACPDTCASTSTSSHFRSSNPTRPEAPTSPPTAPSEASSSTSPLLPRARATTMALLVICASNCRTTQSARWDQVSSLALATRSNMARWRSVSLKRLSFFLCKELNTGLSHSAKDRRTSLNGLMCWDKATVALSLLNGFQVAPQIAWPEASTSDVLLDASTSHVPEASAARANSTKPFPMTPTKRKVPNGPSSV